MSLIVVSLFVIFSLLCADDGSPSFGSSYYPLPDEPPFVPMLFVPIKPSRTEVSATQNAVTVYQLKTCRVDSYLRIGKDGSVSAVESRYDLNSKYILSN